MKLSMTSRTLFRVIRITAIAVVMSTIHSDREASRHLSSMEMQEYILTNDFMKRAPMPSMNTGMLHDEWKNLVNETARPPLRYVVLPHTRRSPCLSDLGTDAITAVTHLGVSKLERLLILTELWDGPVSAAVYITGPQDIDRLASFWNGQIEKDGNATSTRSILCHISLHVIMEYMDPSAPANENKTLSTFGYPHNVMRNAALDNCDSDYFATLDVDFVTFPGAHATLQTILDAGNAELRNQMKFNRSMLWKIRSWSD